MFLLNVLIIENEYLSDSNKNLKESNLFTILLMFKFKIENRLLLLFGMSHETSFGR
jgi:hypothetical protein